MAIAHAEPDAGQPPGGRKVHGMREVGDAVRGAEVLERDEEPVPSQRREDRREVKAGEDGFGYNCVW
eukprot:3545253-Pyramimonas_sp.AAC.1